MDQQEKVSINRNGWILIGASWPIMQLVYVSVYGINQENEAAKYISLANDFVEGSRNLSLHK